MHVSQHYDGQRLALSALGRDARSLGMASALAKVTVAVASFAEDLVILAQFAFGREYVPLGKGQTPYRR